jgi:hypothetical protein
MKRRAHRWLHDASPGKEKTLALFDRCLKAGATLYNLLHELGAKIDTKAAWKIKEAGFRLPCDSGERLIF